MHLLVLGAFRHTDGYQVEHAGYASQYALWHLALSYSLDEISHAATDATFSCTLWRSVLSDLTISLKATEPITGS